MATITDQIGNTLTLTDRPCRIISLVPSQTELLCDLGLEEELVGITKFCVHPEHIFRSKTRVGGTKTVHIDKVRALQPDLIIANKEENEKSQVEELAGEFPVWVSDISDLSDALAMIGSIGEITGKQDEAGRLVNDIRAGFDNLENTLEKSGRTAAYLIWNRPIMCAGGHTFVDSMLQRCGLQNVFSSKSGRYPEVTQGELRQQAPDLLLLSSEPFPFKEQHAEEYTKLLPRTEVKLVDGELFSWYGSRLLKAPEYFREIFV